MDNNVFIGISGGGNDVDNKLFKAKKDIFIICSPTEIIKMQKIYRKY
ncbi:hypothetical protein NWQ33_00650 [Mycoplasmopsis cynos]|nr:hypothetical protein [Mycoplasmopsis cynos]